LTIERKDVDAAEEASTLHRVLAIMCIFFELIRKGSCSRIGLALFPKELMSTTFPLPQSLPLDSEEDDDFEFNSVIIFSVESKGISPDSNRIMAFGNRIHDFVVPGRKIFWLSALDVGTAGT
ncbi:hypothetical protein HID58_066831, partial [Brassica napus]